MTLLELRRRATELAQWIVGARDTYHQRKADGKTGDELRSQAERDEWSAKNAEYTGILKQIQELEAEARFVEESAAAEQWLQRATAEPNRRPNMGDQVPGQPGTTYGDLGLDTRDQARQLEQRQRDLTLAWRSWCGYGVPESIYDPHGNEQVRGACERLKFNPATGTLNLRFSDTEPYRQFQRVVTRCHPQLREQRINEFLTGIERRNLSSGVGASGGYVTVPASVVRMIELAMLSYSGVMQAADTITTETGEDMSWPVGDDTSNQASYTDENVAVSTTSVDPSFEQVTWRAHDLQSGFVRASYRLFRDAAVNIDAIITQMIGERFGRKLEAEFTTGAAKIRGLITRAPVGQTTAGATAITYADVLGLEHSVDPSLRSGMAFMFHDAVLEYLRGILDGTSRPLWQSNLTAGAPDTFNGRPYFINQNMASTVATTNKTMAAGDFSYYKVRKVGPSLRLKRLVERFAENDQTAFIGYMSCDGNLLRPNANASSPVQVLQQA